MSLFAIILNISIYHAGIFSLLTVHFLIIMLIQESAAPNNTRVNQREHCTH